MFYFGIDLGTSGVKGIIIDEYGKVMRENSIPYAVSYPQDGWSEQNPKDWLFAVNRLIGTLSCGIEDKIAGIAVAGQMHGLVILDEHDEPIRPCILWNDGRSSKETEYLNSVIGKNFLSANTANIAFAGFTAPKLLWLYENERDHFEKIRKIMLPKDYIVYMLTGEYVTDYSDASGTLFFDVKNKKWSENMCRILRISPDILPRLCESYFIVGKIKDEYGLKNCVVAAGAGDNAAAAIGTGAIARGKANISLGTSGTLFIANDRFAVDDENALHSFCHANGEYHLMGCILSAASANKWWVEDVLKSNDYDGEILHCEELFGKNRTFFLPYLMGERCPHNDVNARGAFIGMRIDTTRKEMSLAVLEGVAFALKDCAEAARKIGITIKSSTFCGGGAKSRVWRKVLANVFDAEILIPEVEQGPSYGAAILAMVAADRYASVKEAVNNVVKIKDIVRPEKDIVLAYTEKYELYSSLYPALKDVFKKM